MFELNFSINVLYQCKENALHIKLKNSIIWLKEKKICNLNSTLSCIIYTSLLFCSLIVLLLQENYCFIKGVCVPEGKWKTPSSCLICDPQTDVYNWVYGNKNVLVLII